MAAPTIVSHSYATTSTPGLTLTIPAPTGLAAGHSLIAFLIGIETPVGVARASGWGSTFTPGQLTGVTHAGTSDFPGAMLAAVILEDTVVAPPSDYTFQFLSVAGILDEVPDTKTFDGAHGYLLAIDRGTGTTPTTDSDGAAHFEGDTTYDGIDTNYPPSLLLHFFAGRNTSAVSVSGGFGTTVDSGGSAIDAVSIIGAIDTTGDTAGTNHGTMTFSIAGRSFLGQTELRPRTPFTPPAGRASWGVLAS
jgi:hypothetical protein